MAYNSNNKNEHNAKGFSIAIVIHLLLLLVFFLSSMAIPNKEPDKITGIIVNFGDAKTGTKVTNPNATSKQETKTVVNETSSSSASSAASKPIIDEKIEEVKAKEQFSLSTEDKKKKDKSKKEDKKKSSDTKSENKKDNSKKENTKSTTEKQKEQTPKQPDRLFTKKENKSDNTKVSEGNERNNFTDKGNNTEDTASQDSEEYSNQYASELSSKGITANLRGRVLKYIPDVKKRFQTNGKVVIKIKVDQSGKVIQVDQDISKSTTNDPSLVKIALDTATKALFNQDFNASIRQNGSITFEFKVQ